MPEATVLNTNLMLTGEIDLGTSSLSTTDWLVWFLISLLLSSIEFNSEFFLKSSDLMSNFF